MPKVGFRMPFLKHFPALFYFLRQALSFQLIILARPTGQQQPPELPLFAPSTDVQGTSQHPGLLGRSWRSEFRSPCFHSKHLAQSIPASPRRFMVCIIFAALVYYSAWGRQHAAMLTWGQNMTMWIMGQKLNPQSCPQVALPAKPFLQAFFPPRDVSLAWSSSSRFGWLQGSSRIHQTPSSQCWNYKHKTPCPTLLHEFWGWKRESSCSCGKPFTH